MRDLTLTSLSNDIKIGNVARNDSRLSVGSTKPAHVKLNRLTLALGQFMLHVGELPDSRTRWVLKRNVHSMPPAKSHQSNGKPRTLKTFLIFSEHALLTSPRDRPTSTWRSEVDHPNLTRRHPLSNNPLHIHTQKVEMRAGFDIKWRNASKTLFDQSSRKPPAPREQFKTKLSRWSMQHSSFGLC